MTDADRKEIVADITAALAAHERHRTPYWTLEKIGVLLTLIVTTIGSLMGVLNSNKITDVKTGQEAQVVKAEEVKSALDDATTKQEKTLGKLEKESAAVVDSLGPQLWASWRYARDIASETGDAKDIATAAEAKRKYDAHILRQKNGGK